MKNETTKDIQTQLISIYCFVACFPCATVTELLSEVAVSKNGVILQTFAKIPQIGLSSGQQLGHVFVTAFPLAEQIQTFALGLTRVRY